MPGGLERWRRCDSTRRARWLAVGRAFGSAHLLILALAQ
jgi:hypothetical protein